MNPRIPFLHVFRENRRGNPNTFLSDLRIHFLAVLLWRQHEDGIRLYI